jgi:hypothetical protein
MAMMEKYANNLEALVDERTGQLVEEKKKTGNICRAQYWHDWKHETYHNLLNYGPGGGGKQEVLSITNESSCLLQRLTVMHVCQDFCPCFLFRIMCVPVTYVVHINILSYNKLVSDSRHVCNVGPTNNS